MSIITRAQWGARYPDGFGDRPMPITEMWLHHSVTVAPDLQPPFTDDDAAVRTLENIGQSRFGGGISYTRPVTPVGRIYEGHSLHRRGAHTKGHNTVGMAYCLIGNYDILVPSYAQKLAIATDMVALHKAGEATRHTLNGGHRDVFGTACPGMNGYAAIGDINRLAEQLWAGWSGAAASTGRTYTRQDVARFQRSHSIDLDDGLWGPGTERVAQAVRRCLKSGESRSAEDRSIFWQARMGRPEGEQTSTDFRRGIQWALRVKVDGVWGPRTEAAWHAMRDQHNGRY